MFDIDHFKEVNDRFGHEAGDRVLKELTEMIRKRIRTTDLLARWGGEEFMILLANTNLRPAVKLAEDLLQQMQAGTFSGDRTASRRALVSRLTGRAKASTISSPAWTISCTRPKETDAPASRVIPIRPRQPDRFFEKILLRCFR